MDLFEEHGYVRTTVEDIAARAGLTERTFFRYFADKREVLFSGAKELEKGIVDHIEGAPREAKSFTVVTAALEAAGADLLGRRDIRYMRARYALVTEHAELHERELIKLASLARAVTNALHARGVSEPNASLAAEAGIAILKIAFERWMNEKKPTDLAAHIRAAVDALQDVTGERGPPTVRASKKKATQRVVRAKRAQGKATSE